MCGLRKEGTKTQTYTSQSPQISRKWESTRQANTFCVFLSKREARLVTYARNLQTKIVAWEIFHFFPKRRTTLSLEQKNHNKILKQETMRFVLSYYLLLVKNNILSICFALSDWRIFSPFAFASLPVYLSWDRGKGYKFTSFLFSWHMDFTL